MAQFSAPEQTPNRLKLSERAREAIREKIVNGEFSLGRVLREAELLLGMSKSPIREALVQLEHEGLVEMSANRSARVFTLSADDIIALGELRALLESQAIRLSVDRDHLSLARKLQEIAAAEARAVEAADRESASRLDQDFHATIFECCGDAYLEETYQRLSSRIQSLRSRLARERARMGKAAEDHRAILDAVHSCDADRAVAILRTHIDDNTSAYIAWSGRPSDTAAPRRVPLDEMERFARAAMAATDVEAATADAVVRALSHALLHGVDTHGYRLLPHYLQGLEEGRLNRHPKLSFVSERGAVAVLDGGDAQGARATYAAVARVVDLAREYGVGAIAIRGSSHFGAAGAYANAIAEAGMAGPCVCNSHPFVRLHGGAERFHGTNPIAFAASAGCDEAPWLFDMATSAIPFNKVQLSRALGIDLPAGTASDRKGLDVTVPGMVEILALSEPLSDTRVLASPASPKFYRRPCRMRHSAARSHR